MTRLTEMEKVVVSIRIYSVSKWRYRTNEFYHAIPEVASFLTRRKDGARLLRRKIEIASLLNLTLEEAGTLKRGEGERESGGEYEATRASSNATTKPWTRPRGSRDSLISLRTRGCVKILLRR